ncbi:hypothetical protein CHS0354_038442 [Potamilus streckersoni]|uniref:Ankyrin repeat, SAM and basic leucine zipper domain-containing protein 1 n=1 Tax=Potamilus streckersoni TaxID=2493646 RepID=A0AAE0S5T0_9BIVA|nr:hypothetical protein CHS0354_038442 [Potamilus streckersoni]
MSCYYTSFPAGAEDDDFDEDGFVFGNETVGESSNNLLNSILWSNCVNETLVEGGFGLPSTELREKVKQKKVSSKDNIIPASHQTESKSMSQGDFQMAVLRGNKDTVQQFLDKGFKVDTVLKSGWSGLMYAANTGNADMVKLLLDKGANPNFHTDKYSVLMSCCGSTSMNEVDLMDCVTLLVDRGADVNSYDRYHMSSLIYAAREGRINVIQKLVDSGANINKQDSRGWTALTWAVSKNHGATVRKLLECKADPKLKHCDGQTAVDLASSLGLEQIRALLNGGTQCVQNGSTSGDSHFQVRPVTAENNGIPNISQMSVGDAPRYFKKYGELELFLAGLELGHLVPLFQQQQVEFADFLRMTDEDLIKMGLEQIGIRKKILDGTRAVHKKPWEKSSLPAVQCKTHITCAEAVAIVANISKHSKYIGSTIGYIADQVKENRDPINNVQDGTGPKQLYQHTVDLMGNVCTLEQELHRLKKQLEDVLPTGNFEPPDAILPVQVTKPRSRLQVYGLVLTGIVVVSVILKRNYFLEK